MPEKVLIIDGHPDREEARLCHALSKAYARGCENGGHEVRHIKVSEVDFPLLRTKAEFESGQLPADVKQAQEAFRWCDHILIVYPLWLGTMPALLKGFFEQVFRPGFAFDQNAKGWPKGNLSGKSARIVVTMGMPAWVYRWIFGAHSLKSLERNVLGFAGIKPIRETIYGMVEPASDTKRENWMSEMQNLGRRAR
ncbi:MAG: putative NADPH-quinone reductase [Hyphomicrobiaceae bacterium]|jgi:putative NADPH-quinone reductase